MFLETGSPVILVEGVTPLSSMFLKEKFYISDVEVIMAEFDLTRKMAPFLDTHLIIPLLEFIEPRKVSCPQSVLKCHQTKWMNEFV